MKKVVKGIAVMAVVFALFGCDQPADNGTPDDSPNAQKTQVAMPTVSNNGSAFQDGKEILFSKGLHFACATNDVLFSYKFSGDSSFTQLASGVTMVSTIPEGSISVTVKATKTGYPDSEEKTTTFSKGYIGETGPGGGTVYKYNVASGDGMEVSANLGLYFLSEAKTESQKLRGGYNNWNLPSKEELNEVYVALKENKDPPLIEETSNLWSSSECADINDYAWTQNFRDGDQVCYPEELLFGVRAIRVFNTSSL